ncbi:MULTISPECIES: N-acetylmannosamine-6-phosphate 2-epimerase [Virgibacillus]|uniref:Putative N-acetylmannosamine-6-phosphate 2-epimerase n=2 Tax=Virgibacillus TaxID=84406 RepID=A0A024Q9D4_9BACI|nr:MULTISPECIES: N-acetylmannosamine-6-phosphate 2-epimerase [Virgibacillus]EQB37642.1 hypothetical protein M948_03565 [Virgibacillus sp. CM-4]MYL40383.1 putative N-acetylmannosamine-6-phosphate 2-epimerase [Virgibacillus massiliensis]GGJ59449.1 putative N-acetylmannosamine-6-phosphate 2-epimerase [Virgibacillus kapii]CDQ38830.1 Putative N-acetylmannosamine-6-phosphate 2-epimerase [Virgibacillus massiliensis]
MLAQVKNGLIVSCQALPDEPLHSSFIMSKLALAAFQGGACGIRANTKEDIVEIKKEVPLPIIGIVKRDYQGSSVFITATKKEIDELIESGCEMIAMDATDRRRPKSATIRDIIKHTNRSAPHVELMADIATVEEAISAQKLGFDCISTTLHGYTEGTNGKKLYDDDFSFLKKVIEHVSIPVIAEGNIVTPDMYKRCKEIGAFACVVGGAITRPKEITKRFINVCG